MSAASGIAPRCSNAHLSPLAPRPQLRYQLPRSTRSAGSSPATARPIAPEDLFDRDDEEGRDGNAEDGEVDEHDDIMAYAARAKAIKDLGPQFGLNYLYQEEKWSIQPSNASIDRILAGGPYDLFNIQMLCATCSYFKYTYTTEETALAVAHQAHSWDAQGGCPAVVMLREGDSCRQTCPLSTSLAFQRGGGLGPQDV